MIPFNIIKNNKIEFIVFFLLIFIIISAYIQVRDFEFITFDDNLYVYECPNVKDGMTFKNILWCLKNPHVYNWHPLTSISLFIDAELSGLKPGAYHLTNLFFHVCNAILLLLVLMIMTKQYWRSLFVAALFAVHPLHVESVAWVSERKDVLSAFFWMLTILSYLWYVSCPKLIRYSIVVLFLILGLLSKPMVVTLPFVLLLIDYWPLRRFQFSEISNKKSSKVDKDTSTRENLSVLLEKIPLFIIVAIFCYITLIVQKSGGMFQVTLFPLDFRISNAVNSYTGYIIKMLWPFNLSIFYPYPDNILLVRTIVSGLSLLLITSITLWFVKKSPCLAVGWFWYLGTLVPVIGIVQVGLQAMADRYTYIPIVGIFIMISWGVPDLISKYRFKMLILSMSAGIVLIICTVSTYYQVGYWKNSNSVYTHAINAVDKNYWAYNQLAHVYVKKGDLDEAINNYLNVLKIKPEPFYSNARYNIGLAYYKTGELDKAVEQWKKLLNYDPDNVETLVNLGVALSEKGDFEESIKHLSDAVQLDPTSEKNQAILKNVLDNKRSIDYSIKKLKEKLLESPKQIDILYKLAVAYASIDNYDEAISYLSRILDIQPTNVQAYYNIACLYSRQNNINEAIKYLGYALDSGFADWNLIKNDPDLKNIRKTNYYDRLIELQKK